MENGLDKIYMITNTLYYLIQMVLTIVFRVEVR